MSSSLPFLEERFLSFPCQMKAYCIVVGNEEEVKDWNDCRVNKEAKRNRSNQIEFDGNNNFS